MLKINQRTEIPPAVQNIQEKCKYSASAIKHDLKNLATCLNIFFNPPNPEKTVNKNTNITTITTLQTKTNELIESCNAQEPNWIENFKTKVTEWNQLCTPEFLKNISKALPEEQQASFVEYIMSTKFFVKACLNEDKISEVDISEVVKGAIYYSNSTYFVVELNSKLSKKINTKKGLLFRILHNIFNNSHTALLKKDIELQKDITAKRKNLAKNYEKKITVLIEEVQNQICITIKDNGIGMTEEELKKYKEGQGFTTKPYDGGLGMSIVYAGLKELNAEIKVSSNKHLEGLELKIFLPLDLNEL